MIFGWQGFQLDLPEEFSPVALTGNRAEGYARLLGERDHAFQVRWLKLRSGTSLEATVCSYLERLQKDARRAKRNFNFRVEEGRYRISGDNPAWGSWVQGASRGYILEMAGKASALPILRRAISSFQEAGSSWNWSVSGLDLRLPEPFKLERSKFFAGRTELEFSRGRSLGRLVGQRWAFAGRLLKDRTADQWAASVLGWRNAQVQSEASGPRLSTRGMEAIVHHDVNTDRLILLSGPSRRIEWRPQWEWIVSANGSLEGEASRLTGSEAAPS